MLALPTLQAQDLPFQLDVDYATFLYDEQESLLELYLAVDASTLSYEQSAAGFVASMPLHLALRPVAGGAPDGASTTAVFDEAMLLQFAIADTSALDEGQYFVEQFRRAVPPGEYTLDVVALEDPEQARPEVRLSLDLTVAGFATMDQASVSDITLASAIQQGEEVEAHFYKNGLIITPNPKALYGEGQNRVYYYLEAYGLPVVTDQAEYTLLTYLSESNLPQPISGYQRRVSRAVRDPDVVVGAFDVSELPSGSYFLRVVFLNENNEALAEQTKKFFVFNPNVERPVAVMDEGLETSLYAVMSEEEVEDNLSQAKVIATQQELAQMRSLRSLEEKRDYLAAFWRRRDTDSDPSVNAARRDFYERIRYAQDRYRTPFEESWETDRGRVLLKYGYPSQVDPRPFDQQLVPHEIWTYESIPGQGQAVFVFADREGLSRYDLIHSTVTGEVSQPNWEQQLRR